jgi:glycosyltransferase involved in cell wall biosynthesis
MRIAYVTLNLMDTIALGGVGRKVRSTIEMWHELGHQACWFATSSVHIDGDWLLFFCFNHNNKIIREFRRSSKLKELLNAVKEYKPDLIYLRAGVYTYPLHRLFTIAPVVLELNTLDLIEYQNRGFLKYALHVLCRNQVYGRAKGFVALSSEIACSRANQKFGTPIAVISNGINMDKYKPLPAPKNSWPCLVYIGTPGNQWQGIDKLIQLAKKCSDYQIELIGVNAKHLNCEIPENVSLHSFMNEQDYLPILARADVAIGTLSLYRKGMHEASPLKVREYLAYGIPVIIAYQDTDFMKENYSFILQLPNSEDNISLNIYEIREFVLKQTGKRVVPETIKFRIHSGYKEKERLKFFKKILDG